MPPVEPPPLDKYVPGASTPAETEKNRTVAALRFCGGGLRWIGRGSWCAAAAFLRFIRRQRPSAAWWSALAATFAAIAAWMTWVTHEQNRLNAVRPELILSDFGFSDQGVRGEIRIRRIENSGNGPALQLFATMALVGTKTGNPMEAYLIAEHMPILRRGESKDVSWRGMLDLPSDSHLKHLKGLGRMVDVNLGFSDVNGNRYETQYRFLAGTKVGVGGTAGELAPGLFMISRITTVSPKSRWFPSYR